MIITCGGSNSPRNSAIEEGRMAINSAFTIPSFHAEIKKTALTIVPVTHWFCGVCARMAGATIAAAIRPVVQSKSLLEVEIHFSVFVLVFCIFIF